MIQNIVDRAKKMAIKDFLTTGAEGHPGRAPAGRVRRRVQGERGPAQHDQPRRLGPHLRQEGRADRLHPHAHHRQGRHRARPLDRQRRQHRPVPLTAPLAAQPYDARPGLVEPGPSRREPAGRRPERAGSGGPGAARRARAASARHPSRNTAEHDRGDHHEREGRAGSGGHAQQHPAGHRARPRPVCRRGRPAARGAATPAPRPSRAPCPARNGHAVSRTPTTAPLSAWLRRPIAANSSDQRGVDDERRHGRPDARRWRARARGATSCRRSCRPRAQVVRHTGPPVRHERPVRGPRAGAAARPSPSSRPRRPPRAGARPGRPRPPRSRTRGSG